MRNSRVIFEKQLKDTLKNKTVLIQFVLFPLMSLIMENAIHMEGMPELFFTKLFSVMYMGMAPLTAMAAILSEEKEKGTLRVLTMANVRPWEYLLGTGAYVWALCMAGSLVMATGLERSQLPFYLLVMGLGLVLSITAGACVGLWSKNQMVATSLMMPVMLALSFLPMLAMFNETIEKVARLLYTQQVRMLLNGMRLQEIGVEGVGILAANALLLGLLFFAVYKRKGLE